MHLSSNPAKRCPVWAPFIHENTPVGRSTVGTYDQFTLWKHRWLTFPEFVERSPFLRRESLERHISLRTENCDENDLLKFGWRLDLSFGWRAWNNLPTKIGIAGFQVYPCRLQNSCGLDLLKSVHCCGTHSLGRPTGCQWIWLMHFGGSQPLKRQII